ncbi:MAG: hypothetical protein IKA60_04075 [Rikenellaceae bacterium]|nr:hypothetical protein [Rikenellaceae bacterium]
MIDKLKKDIAKLSALADGWSKEINPLERELFLDLLRRMYESVRFADVATASSIEPDTLAEVAAAVAAAQELTEEPQESEEPDFEIELIMGDEEEVTLEEEEPAIAPISEPEEELTVEEQPVESIEPAPEIQEEPEVQVEKTPEIAPRPKISKSVINSLYGDAELPKPKENVVAFAAPVVEPVTESGNEPIDVLTTPKTVLGDVINNDAVRLGDSLQSDTMDVATKVAAGSVKSLRDAMGLNDKFVIMRDLFDDDRMRFEVVIDELDAQETFDDAMIYISGFAWNSASEGAKLLMNLLKLKFV